MEKYKKRKWQDKLFINKIWLKKSITEIKEMTNWQMNNSRKKKQNGSVILKLIMQDFMKKYIQQDGMIRREKTND